MNYALKQRIIKKKFFFLKTCLNDSIDTIKRNAGQAITALVATLVIGFAYFPELYRSFWCKLRTHTDNGIIQVSEQYSTEHEIYC